jgi:hypothetical protein
VKKHLKGSKETMSYTAIALAAFDGGRGRVRLATRLLGYEKQAADQVKLLLGMELPEGALFKAADSLDMNLVFLVLLHLEHTTLHSLRRLPPSHSGNNLGAQQLQQPLQLPPYMPEERKRLADFFAMVTVKPEAVALLRLYYRHRDDERLMQMYEFTKAFMDAGTLAVASGYRRAAATVAEAEANGVPLMLGNGGGGGSGGGRGGGGGFGWFSAGVAKSANSSSTKNLPSTSPESGSPAAIALEQRLEGLRRASTLFGARGGSSSSSSSSSSSKAEFAAQAARTSLSTATAHLTAAAVAADSSGSSSSSGSSGSSGAFSSSDRTAVSLNSSASLSFAQRATDEHAELLTYQSGLEKKFGGLNIAAAQQQQQQQQQQLGAPPAARGGGAPFPSPVTFLDLSVSKTIHNLLVLAKAHPGHRNDLFGEASRAQKQFKVPDKRFWHVKVRSLAMSHQWDELRKFANERKSPIG